jgi:hypothetical protein
MRKLPILLAVSAFCAALAVAGCKSILGIEDVQGSEDPVGPNGLRFVSGTIATVGARPQTSGALRLMEEDLELVVPTCAGGLCVRGRIEP